MWRYVEKEDTVRGASTVSCMQVFCSGDAAVLPAIAPYLPPLDPISILDASGRLGLPTTLYARTLVPHKSEIVTLNPLQATQHAIEENLQDLDKDDMDQRTIWNPSGMVSLMHAALVDTETKRMHDEALEQNLNLADQHDQSSEDSALEKLFTGGEATHKATLRELAVCFTIYL